MRQMIDTVNKGLGMLAEGASWKPSDREVFDFMYGGCGSLALAVQRLTGLPMVALLEPDGENACPVHVMNRLPDGRYLDINGVRTLQEIFDDLREQHDIQNTADMWLTKANPALLRAWTQDGYFDAPSASLTREAKEIARRLVATFGSKWRIDTVQEGWGMLAEGAPDFHSVRQLEDWAQYDMDVELRVWDEGNHLFIQYIERCDDAPKGNGKLVMEALTRYADEHGITISLGAASPDLIPYFEQFGFTVQNASTRLMQRTPRHS